MEINYRKIIAYHTLLDTTYTFPMMWSVMELNCVNIGTSVSPLAMHFNFPTNWSTLSLNSEMRLLK